MLGVSCLKVSSRLHHCRSNHQMLFFKCSTKKERNSGEHVRIFHCLRLLLEDTHDLLRAALSLHFPFFTLLPLGACASSKRVGSAAVCENSIRGSKKIQQKSDRLQQKSPARQYSYELAGGWRTHLAGWRTHLAEERFENRCIEISSLLLS